jgi:HD-GYP domain-containing protein (c-di-GMP phosphodiesterase class II)
VLFKELRMGQEQPFHLEQPYLQFVETMAQALDARDPYTAGHSIRVAEYAYAIALGLGLSEGAARTIRIAAQLHDIGKIGMPDAILQKREALTRDEMAFIKLHPQIGRRILERVAGFGKYLSVVELHHENIDGTGYPYGISGTQIPLDARIVRVADSFDAMTSDRSYRGRRSAEFACKEICQFSGKHFDHSVATAFLKLAAEDRIQPVGDAIPVLPGRSDSPYKHLVSLSEALSDAETLAQIS